MMKFVWISSFFGVATSFVSILLASIFGKIIYSGEDSVPRSHAMQWKVQKCPLLEVVVKCPNWFLEILMFSDQVCSIGLHLLHQLTICENQALSGQWIFIRTNHLHFAPTHVNSLSSNLCATNSWSSKTSSWTNSSIPACQQAQLNAAMPKKRSLKCDQIIGRFVICPEKGQLCDPSCV